jgi:hypothetical protein
MIRFIRKHRICSLFIFLLLCLTIYSCIQEYEIREDYRVHRQDHWEKIDITKAGTKVINYHNRSGRYIRCFYLGFKLDEFHARFDHESEVEKMYNIKNPDYMNETGERFYNWIKNRPQFIIKIYKEETLVKESLLYAVSENSISKEQVGNQEINLQLLSMSFAPGQSACYHFEDNTSYVIELINNTPLPIYNGITTVFGFQILWRK